MSKDYLNEEEQFKEIINNEEIDMIKDPKLRNIRLKYWDLQHNAFLDEHGLPDNELKEESDKIRAAERKELEKYKLEKNDKNI